MNGAAHNNLWGAIRFLSSKPRGVITSRKAIIRRAIKSMHSDVAHHAYIEGGFSLLSAEGGV